MKKTARRKVEGGGTEVPTVLRGLFRSFAKLAEQAAGGRPLLRGLRVAHDPKADRFVVVHGGARVEFVLLYDARQPPCAQIECRRIDSAGAAEVSPIARFQFDDIGVVSQSTVPELLGERIDQASGAWSIVAAVLWNALLAPA